MSLSKSEANLPPFANDYGPSLELNTDFTQLPACQASLQSQCSPSLPLLDIERLMTVKPAPFDFVLPSLRLSSAGCLVGAGGSNKSTWALQTAMQMASGVNFMGFDTVPGKVMYVSLEDDEAALWHRVFNITQKYLNDPHRQSQLVQNLGLYTPQCGSFDLLGNPNQLNQVCSKYRLVIIDTLRLSHTGDENDGKEMAELVHRILAAACLHNTAICLLAHSTKTSALAGQVNLAQSIRGSSVLTDNFRWQAYMSAMTIEESKLYTEGSATPIGENNREQYVKFGLSKCNYGPKGEPMWYWRDANGVLSPCKLYPTAQHVVKTPKAPRKNTSVDSNPFIGVRDENGQFQAKLREGIVNNGHRLAGATLNVDKKDKSTALLKTWGRKYEES